MLVFLLVRDFWSRLDLSQSTMLRSITTVATLGCAKASTVVPSTISVRQSSATPGSWKHTATEALRGIEAAILIGRSRTLIRPCASMQNRERHIIRGDLLCLAK